VQTNFFLFDSERTSGIMFNSRPPVKMADFHGEVIFLSVFGHFWGTVHNTTLFVTVKTYVEYCSNVRFTIQMRQLTKITKDISKSLEFRCMFLKLARFQHLCISRPILVQCRVWLLSNVHNEFFHLPEVLFNSNIMNILHKN
jgi:hypothetical protein